MTALGQMLTRVIDRMAGRERLATPRVAEPLVEPRVDTYRPESKLLDCGHISASYATSSSGRTACNDCYNKRF